MAQESSILDPIAIVGFSIKFPGDADTPECFWQMLETKQCAFQAWPKDRLNFEAFMSRDSKGFIPGAHFMKEDCGLFDASFFGVSGTEACTMDPQNRLLLETAYRALENSGIPMENAKGSKTAVYTGCMANDYNHIVSRDADLLPRYTALGASPSMLSNRLSWFFDFHGPSLSVDTACSSSLVALDLACQGLRNGDSDMVSHAMPCLLPRLGIWRTLKRKECSLSSVSTGIGSWSEYHRRRRAGSLALENELSFPRWSLFQL
ncbi:ketoacyl-synt-domain-containing protein [Aspergillus sclerotiicarbonarius CBS 121057]|uniref:Ketoacyl-synt-domain-containing protein n=1 Tax=Aspergillus sclerotiicarbonarius (strain CBS 121057 / IBT 28362) TaxID=1448318 RepID=A0A319E197_ASPSB|nr:ketoacyl-synt-domain-containing protein [Aspergillus sclerotiicarbonarius CBS 121057]